MAVVGYPHENLEQGEEIIMVGWLQSDDVLAQELNKVRLVEVWKKGNSTRAM